MARVTVRLPDGRSFDAGGFEQVALWVREGRVPADAMIEEPGVPPAPAGQHPALATCFPAKEENPMTVLIPFKNGPALAGYYVSVGSLIPIVGLLAGPVAIVLGIMGLRKVKAEPRCRGTAHAIVAIVLGSLTTLLYWGLAIAGVVAATTTK